MPAVWCMGHTHKKTPTKPNALLIPLATLPEYWSLQTVTPKSHKLWCVYSITFSPFQGKPIRVQYFFFSSTLQYRKCYWWTAPKICVIYQKITQRMYELLHKIITLTTDNKSRILFLTKELHSTWKCILPPFGTLSYQFSFLLFFCWQLHLSTSSFQSTLIYLTSEWLLTIYFKQIFCIWFWLKLNNEVLR